MNLSRVTYRDEGFSLVAALVIVLVLAILGGAILYISAVNQGIKAQQIASDRAFYASHAGLEFGLGKILKEHSESSSFGILFGGPVSIIRSNGKLNSSATRYIARETHSITDPFGGGSSDCLVVDVSDAFVFAKELRGITLRRNDMCTGRVIITSMSGTSWSPDKGEKITGIQFGGNVQEFSAPPATPGGSGGEFDFGDRDYVIDNTGTHFLNFVRWNAFVYDHLFRLVFNFTYEGKSYSKTVTVNLTSYEEADCLVWDTTSARLSLGSAGWNRLTGTNITNTCKFQIVLDRMNIIRSPAFSDALLNSVSIGGANIFSGASLNGEEIDVNYLLGPLTSANVDEFVFSDGVMGSNYDVAWIFSDRSSKLVSLPVFSSTEANCLSVDTSTSKVEPTDKKNILGIKVNNVCSGDIGIKGLRLSWSGGPSRFKGAKIYDASGANVYSWDALSGEEVSLGRGLYLRNEEGAKDVEYLSLDSEIPTGTSFTLEFIMVDGTSQVVNFVPRFISDELEINVDGGRIGDADDRHLKGVTLRNKGGLSLVVDKLRISWLPVASPRLLGRVSIGGSIVWSGSVGTGVVIDIADTTIIPFEVKPIDFFEFDGDMSGRSFVIEALLSDGTSVISRSFAPPDE